MNPKRAGALASFAGQKTITLVNRRLKKLEGGCV